MATFSGIVQLIKDLAEQTSASDSDNLIIGSTTMKRIAMANIAKYIKGKRKQSKSVFTVMETVPFLQVQQTELIHCYLRLPVWVMAL